MEKILKAWGLGCKGSLFFQGFTAILLFIAIFLLALSAAFVPLPNEDQYNRWFIFSAGFVFIIIGAISAAWVIGIRDLILRGHTIDAAFAPLGLKGRSFMFNGRQFHGIHQARQVDAYFYRGPTLDIYLSTSLKTRFGISEKSKLSSFITRALHSHLLTFEDAVLNHFDCFCKDEIWTRALLAEMPAREIILRLATPTRQGGVETRQVLLQPGGWHFKLYRTHLEQICAQNIQRWVGDLVELTRIAESLPSPQITTEASALEKNAQMNRQAFARPAIIITIAAFVTLALCFMLPFVFLLMTNGW